MNAFFAVFKKELKAYIDHPMAYIIAIVFLVLNNFLFIRTAIVQETASLRAMFQLLPWVNLFFISAMTMRTWAEERRAHTLNVLLSYPAAVWQIVLGKYAASLTFFAAVLALTLPVAFGLAGAGTLDWGVVTGQYFGALLLAVGMVAVGQWASTLTKNQVIAFIIAIAVQFTLFLISMDFVLLSFPYPLNLIGQQLGILSHFNSVTRGVIDLRDVLYFVSMAFVFLALSYAWLVRAKSNREAPDWRKLQMSVAILIIIAVVINLFGQSFTVRFDLTEQNLYSLSDATKRVLRELDDTVRITMYRSKKLPTQVELVSRDVQDTLNDYKKYGGRNVTLEVKYPDENADIAAEARNKGIPAIRFNVVRQDEFTLQEGYLGVILEYLDKRETIPFLQTTEDLEYRLTRAIFTLQNPERSKVGYVSDFGGAGLDTWTKFAELLRSNYTVEQITLATPDEQSKPQEIDETIDALIIAAPTQAFSEAALTELEKYIDRGGKILWVLSGIIVDQQSLAVRKNETGLDRLLAKGGITINKDLVADLLSHQTVNFSAGLFTYLLPYPFWINAALQNHVLAGNVQQVMVPWPSSITIGSEAKDVYPLIVTTEKSVKQTSGYQINPDTLPDFSKMPMDKSLLAVVAENVPAAADAQSGRWVVITATDFLEDGITNQHQQNLSLALNSVDWLLQNEALIGIRSKQGASAALIWKSRQQQNLVQWGNIIGVPVLVAAVAGYWLWRRRRLSRQTSA